jgi:hypothetical protein
MSGTGGPPTPPRTKGPPPGVSPLVAELREKVKILEDMLNQATRQVEEIDSLATAYQESADAATQANANYRLCKVELEQCKLALAKKGGTRRRHVRHIRKRTGRVPRK